MIVIVIDRVGHCCIQVFLHTRQFSSQDQMIKVIDAGVSEVVCAGTEKKNILQQQLVVGGMLV